jgi:hypothetical protein
MNRLASKWRADQTDDEGAPVQDRMAEHGLRGVLQYRTGSGPNYVHLVPDQLDSSPPAKPS